MTPLIIVILAAMWLVVLVPPLLRSRSEARPSESISSFQRQLSTLGRSTPTGTFRPARPLGYAGPPARVTARPHGPRTTTFGPAPRTQRAAAYGPATRGWSAAPPHRLSQRTAAKRRRQQVLLTLVALAFFTAVLSFGLGIQAALVAHVVVDALLVGYVYLLVQLRKLEEERALRLQWQQAA